jgi:hypothetical protein
VKTERRLVLPVLGGVFLCGGGLWRFASRGQLRQRHRKRPPVRGGQVALLVSRVPRSEGCYGIGGLSGAECPWGEGPYVNAVSRGMIPANWRGWLGRLRAANGRCSTRRVSGF